MRSYNYEPNSLVVKRGESSDCIYFLKQGTIFIEMPLKRSERMHFDTITSGSSFSIYDTFNEDMK